jgi:hypothetical protein
MYRNFSINAKERRQIMEMHVSSGYKKSLNESASESTSMAQKAIQMAKSNGGDENMMEHIKNCITSGSYTHLMVLTTGAGASVLGALSVLFASGVGTIPALLLSAAGVIVVTIEGLMTTKDSGVQGSVSSEIEKLYNCLKSKKVI